MVKYVLSLDSGGIRSTIQIYFLYYLEQDLKRITGKTIFETFDFFAGTSGGSIVLGAIVYSKYQSIEDILKNYFSLITMKRIFKRSLFSYLLGNFTRPKYDNTEKYQVLYENIGPKLVSDTTKDVLISTYSMTKEIPRFFKSYEKKEEITDPVQVQVLGSKTLVVDVINASSAAPGYFPTEKYEYDMQIEYGTDGAIFASDPSDCAYADALKLYGPNEDIRILSIGTGSRECPSYSKETRAWGLFQWVTKGDIINKLIDVDPKTATYRMEQFTKALGHKYVRIQGQTDIKIDDVDSMDELKLIGLTWYSENKENVFKTLFREYV